MAVEISTIEELQAIEEDLTADYIQINDIDAFDTKNWNDGQGFSRLGSNSNRFSGSFDGQNYKITDLYINRPSTFHVGLFGYTDDVAIVKNIITKNFDITGYNYTGSIVGYNRGSVENCISKFVSINAEDYTGGVVGYLYSGSVNKCSSDGEVTGIIYVGGLIGYSNQSVTNSYSKANVSGSEIVGGLTGLIGHDLENSYSQGDVSGNDKVGGLVGQNSQSINLSYSTGTVTGSTNVGGLVGYDNYASVTNSYWDTQTSGQSTSDGGIGKTTTEMQTIITYEPEWDIENINSIYIRNTTFTWNIVENESYPLLSWEETPHQPPTIINNFIEISSLNDLEKIGNDPEYPLNGNYIQINDINAIETKEWNGGQGFIPIGSDINPFTGLYNGNGYKIKYLHINKEEYSEYENYIGFISYNSGTIKNLGLENAQISGTSYIGGICGFNNGGLIERVYVSGKIYGLEDYIGGICGYTKNNEITNAINNAEISGGDFIGGLIGYNENTIIYKSLSTGLIQADGYEVGGLIGYSENDSDIIKSYWDTETSTYTISSGGTGHTTQELTYPYASNVYEDWDFINFISNDFNKEVSNGYPYLSFAEPDRSLTVEYFLELRNPNGQLISPLKWNRGTLHEYLNEPFELNLTLPFNDDLDEYFTPNNEIRLYDSKNKLINRFYSSRIERYGGSTDEISITAFSPLFLLRRTWIEEYQNNTTFETILNDLINEQPEETIKIQIAHIDESIKNSSINFNVENINLLGAINELLNIVGGYVQVDKFLELYWTVDIGEDKGQQIQLGKNLIDVEWEKDTSELVNKLFLKGALTNGLRVEIPEVLTDQSSIDKYGVFEKTFIREDISDQTELENEAQRLLEKHSHPKNKYRINAVDIAKQREIDNSFYEWKLGNKIRVINSRINLDVTHLRILEIERVLDNPLDSSLTLGEKTEDLTDRVEEVSRAVSRIRRETEGISSRVPEALSEYTARVFSGNDLNEVDELTEGSPSEIDEFRRYKDFAFTTIEPFKHLHIRTGEEEWSEIRADNRMYIEATLDDIWALEDQPAVAFSFESGDRAYTTNDNRFYIFNGTNWDLVNPIFVENSLSNIQDLENSTNLNINFREGDRAFTSSDKRYWIYDGTYWRPADSIWRNSVNNNAAILGDLFIGEDTDINEYKIMFYNGTNWKNLTHFDNSSD